jgi:signal transduction histidine kinase
MQRFPPLLGPENSANAADISEARRRRQILWHFGGARYNRRNLHSTIPIVWLFIVVTATALCAGWWWERRRFRRLPAPGAESPRGWRRIRVFFSTWLPFEAMFASHPDALLLFDGRGQFLCANQSARTLLSPDSAHANDLSRCLRGVDSAALLAGQACAVPHGEKKLALRPLYGAGVRRHSRFGRALWLLVDESAQAQHKEHLRHTQENLQNEVQTRTRRIHHQQRLQALSVLNGRIADAFAERLRIIRDAANRATEALPPDSPLREDMDEIAHAMRRAKELIHTMAAAAADDAEPLPMIALDLHALMVDTLRLAQTSAHRHVELRIAACRDPVWICGNPDRLHQAIMNLVINALHAMSANGGVLHVAVRQRVVSAPLSCANAVLPAGPYVELAVSDEGAGIPKEMQQRIFDLFFTTREEGEGTGLGLATVWQVAAEHGAGLLVESASGQGSAFRLLFPERAKPLRPVTPLVAVSARGDDEVSP